MGLSKPVLSQLEDWYEHLAKGWRELSQYANRALTHFIPSRETAINDDTKSHGAITRGVRWGLLPVEMREEKQSIVIQVEVPGLEKEDLVVDEFNGSLRIKGEKRAEQEHDEQAYHVVERAYGCFERIIPLPVEVVFERSSAKYRNGVLEVTLPKLKDREGARKIAILS